MTENAVYLDHNATTPVDPEVAEAMVECLRAGYANPASQHHLGQHARRKLDEARDTIASLLGARTTGMEPDRVIITSGGTEANNLAIRGLSAGRSGNIVISSLEHPCVSNTSKQVATGREVSLRRLPASQDGRLRTDVIPEMIDDESLLVSVMLANHETGVVQPVTQIVDACRATKKLSENLKKRGGQAHFAPKTPQNEPVPGGFRIRSKTVVHTDAAQAVGKLPVNFRQLETDALTVSAHKFGGPVGVGVLIIRHGVPLEPILHGGFQQLGLRPGTESVALTTGLSVALERAVGELESRRQHFLHLRDEFEQNLTARIDNLVIHGRCCHRLPQTSCISFLGVDRQALMMALDMAGIACSTGSACASGSSEPSPVLQAMGCSEAEISSAIRFSFGVQNTLAEAAEAANRITSVINNLRQ